MLQILDDSGRKILSAGARVSACSWKRWFPISAVLLAALAIRITVAVTQPNIIWADEVFQTVEPAHGLAFGTWLPTWEWVVGMRSWLVPAVLAPALWIGGIVDPGRHFGTAPVTALMLLLSLVPVIVGYRWGEQAGGRRGAVVVGGICAVWVDLVYLAPHPLTDNLASHTLLLALYAAFAGPVPASHRRLMVAGALMSLSVYLRMQLGPALLVAAALAGGTSARRWQALLMGGAPTLAALGALDWLTLGSPFQSIWLNYYYNIIAQVSSTYSTQGPLFYVGGLAVIWGAAAPVMMILMYFGARRWPALLWVSLAILATQSLVAHKEWRFIFPALAPMIILSSLQIVSCLPKIDALLQRTGYPRVAAVATCLAATAAFSAVISVSPIYRAFWSHDEHLIRSVRLIAQQKGVCGVGTLFPSDRKDTPPTYSWVGGMGSASLPQGIPQFAALPTMNWRSAASYNWAAIVSNAQTPPQPFHLVRCFGSGELYLGRPEKTCVWSRPGGCDPSQAIPPAMNWPAYFVDDRGALRTERLHPKFLGMTPRVHTFRQPH